jgi:hypothetical protein
VCLASGSPTFTVKSFARNGDIVVTVFNMNQGKVQDFKFAPALLKTIKEFNSHKRQLEMDANDRLIELPEGLPRSQIITVGFDSIELRQKFLDRMFDEQVQGELIGEDTSKLMN